MPLDAVVPALVLTGRVKKVGCFDSSSYLLSVEPPASTDLDVVFFPIPIVSRMSRTCIQHPEDAPGMTGQVPRTIIQPAAPPGITKALSNPAGTSGWLV